jgi:hypothetical protein
MLAMRSRQSVYVLITNLRCVVVITPKVTQFFGVSKHDNLPKDQPEAWARFWAWYLTTPYAIFVPDVSSSSTEHTERLGCLFTEVPQWVLGVCGCARCVTRNTPPALAGLRRP